MKKRTLFNAAVTLIIVLLLAGCDSVTDPDPVPDTTPSANYQLIWSEEFDQSDTVPDPARWNYDLGYGYNGNNDGWGNDEWQNYTDSEANVRVEDGKLILTATWDSTNYIAPGKRDGSVTSGRINTKDKFSVQYGKVQGRIKPPTGAGMWPAFWMLGSNFDDIGWPQCGEIDIMEMSPLYHDDQTSICTVHWWDDDSGSHQSYGSTRVLGESLSNDFHIFEIEWDSQRIVGRIDGMTYMVKTIDQDTMDEFLNDFYLIVNVAVGGGFGGFPDETTPWPQTMEVDWIRVYQRESTEEPVETFGIFTDETPVDAGLTVGLDAQIYVWENTLAQGGIQPYEGDNGISWVTTGAGWFGAGIESEQPLDLSDFAGGNLNFMIKIPADVTFQIGINDTEGHESYVTFPGGETAYGLERTGDWGQAVVPVQEIMGMVDLTKVGYVFMIKEENGAQCQLAIDDIYLDGGGSIVTSVAFDANGYTTDDTGAIVTVSDENAAGTTVPALIGNGIESIEIDIPLDGSASGSGAVNFGPTDDATDTIEIEPGTILTASYTDSAGNVKTDSAVVTAGGPSLPTFGVFTDTTPITEGITPGADAQIFVWENTLTSGSIPPYEGENVISWVTAGMGWFGAGIQANQAQDLSAYAGGTLQFMIKIPSTVTFKIGITDGPNENYVTFPAGQEAFGLVRDGEWGRAVIPLDTIITSVNLSSVSYLFTILEESGAQCEFAIDDIWYQAPSSSQRLKIETTK